MVKDINLEEEMYFILKVDKECIENDNMLHVAVWMSQNEKLMDMDASEFIRDYVHGKYISTEDINKAKKKLINRGRLAEKNHFDGHNYNAHRDHVRLTRKLLELYEFMKDGSWRTVEEIHKELGHPHTTISSMLRSLRKAKYGYHNVPGRRRGDSVMFEYKLIINK